MSPQVDGGGRRSLQDMRELELTVLTQLRESISLTNANLQKLADKVDETHSHVIQLSAARYDEQIRRLEDNYKADLHSLTLRVDSNEGRLNSQALQLARFGMGMAISAALAAAAMSALVVIIVNKIFGVGHVG